MGQKPYEKIKCQDCKIFKKIPDISQSFRKLHMINSQVPIHRGGQNLNKFQIPNENQLGG
jgi:hypothetical protein